MKGKNHTALLEWQQRTKKEDLPCNKCKKVGLMTLDHIIPASFLHMLGIEKLCYDDDWNFQYLCKVCNYSKANRLDWSDPRTPVNLKRYVDKANEYFHA